METLLKNAILTYQVDTDGIAIITLDMEGYPTNILNAQTIPAILAVAKKAIADEKVKGVIITSNKKDFVAGADLNYILKMESPEQAFKDVLAFNQGFLEIERGGKPFVAAINGNCLGGGYEVALACHHRIAVNHPKIRIGLPEVQLGLLPGAGGTQRLPRMIGFEQALQLILQAKTLAPSKAKASGLVDDLVEDIADLLPKAKQWILEVGTAQQPWDAGRFRLPGGKVMSPKGFQTFGAGTALLRKKTKGNFPSAQFAMSAIYEGLQLPMDRAVVVEARYFTKALFTKEARNIIRTGFFGINNANKGEARPKTVAEKFVPKKVGILGAGMMGAGIGFVTAKAGIDIVLKDISVENAEKGKAYSQKIVQKGVQRGKVTKEKGEALLSRIHPTDSAADLTGCDLVIEAVFEHRGLKAKVTQEAEAVLADKAIFASNTSTLPITGLAEASKRPENFIGLHFFSPVDKMPLVEIIVGKETSDYALAAAIDYVTKIRKTPIVVNDSRGFFTSRVFSTFTNEGMALLSEGVPPALIENAAKDAGMPVGPLAVSDEVNLALMYKIIKQTEKDLNYTDESASAKTVRLFIDTLDRPGKKEGKGFYAYPAGEKKHLWAGLAEHFPIQDNHPDYKTVQKRLLHIQSLETYRCLEENVLQKAVDGDIGSILGLGFPVHTGGAISYIDYIGIQQFVADCDEFTAKYGDRFKVPDSLRAKAEKNESFY